MKIFQVPQVPGFWDNFAAIILFINMSLECAHPYCPQLTPCSRSASQATETILKHTRNVDDGSGVHIVPN